MLIILEQGFPQVYFILHDLGIFLKKIAYLPNKLCNLLIYNNLKYGQKTSNLARHLILSIFRGVFYNLRTDLSTVFVNNVARSKTRRLRLV